MQRIILSLINQRFIENYKCRYLKKYRNQLRKKLNICEYYTFYIYMKLNLTLKRPKKAKNIVIYIY